MAEYFGTGSMPLFASKALCFKMIYEIMREEEMGIDVVSSGEIYVASKAGFDLSRAFFHGNNKTDADIVYAMEQGVGFFVCDNEDELDAIDREAGKRGIRQKILLRIAPGIDPHTHAKISTGSVDSKFGAAIETGQAEKFCLSALKKENIGLILFRSLSRLRRAANEKVWSSFSKLVGSRGKASVSPVATGEILYASKMQELLRTL